MELTYDSVIPSGDWLRGELDKNYPFPVTLCRLFYRSIHDTYLVRSGEKEYYFKLYRYGFRNKNDIELELKRVCWLYQSGIQVAMPIEKIDTSFIYPIQTVQGMRWGVLFSKAGDVPVSQEPETMALNRKLGCYLAKMHTAWESMPESNNGHLLNVDALIQKPMESFRRFAQIYPVDLEFVEEVALGVSEALREWNADCICHGDFYLGNICLNKEGELVSFDFDFSGKGYREYDISLYACAFDLGCTEEGLKKREHRMDEFLEGYTSVHSLSQKQIDKIPVMIPLRRIFNLGILYASMYTTFGDAWAIQNVQEDIRKLKIWMKRNPLL